jgi:hypothetical protein
MFPTLYRRIILSTESGQQGHYFQVGNDMNFLQVDLPGAVIYDFHFELTSTEDRIIQFRQFQGGDPAFGMLDLLALPRLQLIKHTISLGFPRQGPGWGVQILVPSEEDGYPSTPEPITQSSRIFGHATAVPRQ